MPDLAKATFKGDRETIFKGWFHQELQNTKGDRAPLEQKWISLLEQWRANLPTDTKEFPWPGAANLVFPLTDMHATPVYADLMQTLHAPEDYWTPVAKRPDRANVASPLREFMTAVERSFLHMRQVNGRAFLDNNILGTAIYKVHWKNVSIPRRDYNEVGEIQKFAHVTSQPVIDPVPLEHFYIPANASFIDPDAPFGGAQWVAQEFHLTEAQLRARVASEIGLPGYDAEAVEKAIQNERDTHTVVEDKQHKLDEYQPWRNYKITLYEVWVRFDVDDDGIEEDLVVVWHHETQSILRITHQPYFHGKRPFHRTVYLPTSGFYGMGIAEIDEWAQLTMTKLLNATIDNTMVANTRMFYAPQGSNIMPGEPVYPGKIWLLPPQGTMGEVKLGEVYPSMFQLQSMFMQWAEMRTAVSELRQGNISGLPSRTPATTVLSILREGNKRFDMILSNIRDVHSEMGLQVLQLIAQNYHDDEVRWSQFCIDALGQDDAVQVMQLFQFPVHKLESEWGMSVTATSGLVNKEVEKQAFVGLAQLLTQMYGQLVQTAMMIQQLPPGSPAALTAESSYVSGVELIKRLLERFDVQNPSDYVPNLSAIAAAFEMQGQGINPAMPGVAPTPMQPGAPGAPGAAGAMGLGFPPGGLNPQQFGSLFGL